MKKILALDNFLVVGSEDCIDVMDYEHNTLFKIENLNSVHDMSYGIIGDGCGGGRLFILELYAVKVFDFETKEIMEIYTQAEKMYSFSKKGCDLFITTDERILKFNLSMMRAEISLIKPIF